MNWCGPATTRWWRRCRRAPTTWAARNCRSRRTRGTRLPASCLASAPARSSRATRPPGCRAGGRTPSTCRTISGPVRNLTLNLGLRWSYESPFRPSTGSSRSSIPTATDPITGLMGAIVHQPGQLARKDLNNFQPRLGLAWNFRPNLVFRSQLRHHHQRPDDQRHQSELRRVPGHAPTCRLPPGDPRHVFQALPGSAGRSASTSQPDGQRAVCRHELRRPQRYLV